MECVSYDLKAGRANSNKFYYDLEKLVDRLLKYIHKNTRDIMEEFRTYSKDNNIKIRTEEEYYLELIMLGEYWALYSSSAENVNKIKGNIIRKLYELGKYKILKKPSDYIRGVLMSLFLLKKEEKIIKTSIKSLEETLFWLKSTCEYDEELKRLNEWFDFFNTFNFSDFNNKFNEIILTTIDFEIESEKLLYTYIRNVRNFLQNNAPNRKWKENFFFCSKQETEYYINMIGAEILNRKLRSEFIKKNKKILVLPICMKDTPINKCMAKLINGEIFCSNCRKDCNINKISKIGRKLGFEVIIIPNYSNLKKCLKRWKNNKEVGFIAVSSVLNLLTVRYQMLDLNISSQCIFLEESGCEKNWKKKKVSTEIDINRLRKIISYREI